MQQIKLNGRTFAAIELSPEDELKMIVVSSESHSEPHYDAKENMLYLPKACDYKNLGYTGDFTEDQWAGIVERFNNGAYRDYALKRFDACDETMPFFLTATESGHSLLASNGITSNNTLLIEIL